jgi:Uma2 family endonuclease
MVQTLVKCFTLDEFLKLPETKPAKELIDGQIIQKPMPQGKQCLQFYLSKLFILISPPSVPIPFAILKSGYQKY